MPESSNLLAELIEGLRCLPGVGARSAQRMAFHLLERDRDGGRRLADVLERAMRLIEPRLDGWPALLLLTAIGAIFYGIALLAISRSWRDRLLSLPRNLGKNDR